MSNRPVHRTVAWSHQFFQSAWVAGGFAVGIWRALGLTLFMAGAVLTSASLALSDVRASGARPQRPTSNPPAAIVIDTPSAAATPLSMPSPAPRQPHLDLLAQSISRIAAGAPGHVTVSLIELGGPAPQSWSYSGSIAIAAASTYKLPALMVDAGLVANGTAANADQLCYQADDWEDGWFSDYQIGACFSRAELANRAGHFSDNTAAHILVRDLGGAAALNAFATANGATSSSFFVKNTTTADDLARLWAAEARGQAGGASAQTWLYPLLTHTAHEQGIPAGVPAPATVVHKTGVLETVVNDAALVIGGANGAYVLAVMTDGAGGDAGWALIRSISAAVWQYESGR